MFLNKRLMSPEFLYYKALEKRTELDFEERRNLYNIQKGFDGECLYDKILDEIGHESVYILRNLYLKAGKSITQFDSIVISMDRVAVNEIKNYSGDYHYENNTWYRNGKQLKDNAHIQLSRAKGKIIQLRDEAGLHFNVEGAVIFTGDDFRLTTESDYIWSETVIRNQLRNYFRQFKDDRISDKAKSIVRHIKNAIAENPYFEEKADLSRLQRGLYCGKCESFDLRKGRFQFACASCGAIESNETHLLRAMSDHKFLFYNQPITKQSILHLIDNQISEDVVYRFLKKYCHTNLMGKKTTYTFKYYDWEEPIAEIKQNQRYKDKIES
ncbi:NERD domain-containing protein [Jeotgalicoccus nanhaiensis]|uniref:NERD domain-containing protein n=1 Tax=Jeotgalicoccus nanhaiensis TaxID=568603 RepID=A0ABR9Y1K7_9STAP|nr:nuclease-related domain-containing protein [Jeotgalicoccus nanhaiensis]MBF0754614.1 NERD domain-containing protein [Jeotgalicoccus nanhaiensis]TFU60961.1 NERD domain-containing protein [Jeotgalicoccus nanhaiensis]